MKKNIHPQYYKQAKIKCACGNELTTGSTVETIDVEICSACHPFYTGKQKLVDTARRVDRFKRIAGKKSDYRTKKEKRLNSKRPKQDK